jgi:isopentenyl-diphosphate delta-isomerase
MEPAPDASSRQVSFDDEPLILVDGDNNVVGYEKKAACHVGEGILHRAFSVFVFDEQGRLLLQQRSGEKPLWPLFWSNSCCSHPRRGEDEAEAAARRVQEELGITVPLEYVYTFQYHAPFEDKGSEREVCSVFLARTADAIVANENEIADWRWVGIEAFEQEMAEHPERFTPWLKMEWRALRSTHRDRLASYL